MSFPMLSHSEMLWWCKFAWIRCIRAQKCLYLSNEIEFVLIYNTLSNFKWRHEFKRKWFALKFELTVQLSICSIWSEFANKLFSSNFQTAKEKPNLKKILLNSQSKWFLGFVFLIDGPTASGIMMNISLIWFYFRTYTNLY